MHFHIPKPLHGWRELAGEVGVIVLGVLIALGFESAVEGIKWHNKVAEARLQLRDEVGHNLALLNHRISEQRCIDRRLAELSSVLVTASVSARLPPIGFIARASTYTWPTTSWQSQVAAETAGHFPAQQIAAIGRVYSIIALVHDNNVREHQAWNTLDGMVGPGGAVDAETLSRLIDALTVARDSNNSFGPLRQGINKVLVNGGLGTDFPTIDPKNPPILGNSNAICQPIGKVAPKSFGMD